MAICLDKITLDHFKLDAERSSAVVTTIGLDKITLDQFTLDVRRRDTVDSSIKIKWNQASMVFPECKIKYAQSGKVWSESKLKYNQKSYINNEISIKYNQFHYIESTPLSIKYNQNSMIYPQIGIKYNSKSMVYPQNSIKYNQKSYIYSECKSKYRQVVFINNLLKIKYTQSGMVYSQIGIKYNSKTMVYPQIKLKWDQDAYISALLKVKYIQGPPIKTTLVNYLEITTPQGDKMYPIIADASFTKGTDIDTAKITIYENVPPYSLCRLIVNYNIILFEGMSMSCPKKDNTYELEVVDYLEHLQPNSPKPGLYLRKYNWVDVPLENFISSNKPTDNNNIIGLIYMANSVIHHVLFEDYDVNNYIYVWQITGSTQTINEVFQDTTLLTKKNSETELQTSSGWYYDSVNNRFFIRYTDNVSPYDHVTTIPNIWDGPMPIRIGTIATSKATSVLAFVSTADFDIPLETLNTYLYSLGLEYESSVRGGIAYIDISEFRGSGSISKPANTYVSSLNIIKIDEIDSNNVKYSTNGVILQGYGTGAGSITAGVYRNMNIGGRFIYLEDATIHGETQATDYVNKYLEEMYLPAQTITFEVPLDRQGVYDNRSVGDHVKVLVPVEDFVEDLRIQQLDVYLKDSLIKITAGDRLFSFEQRLKAIASANEKYRKHLEDTVEEISLNWNNNIDAGITRDFDFEIKDDVLSVQKLEISFDVSPFVADTLSSSGTSCPEGSAGPEQGTTHGHKIKAGENTDIAALTIDVAAKTHKHSLSLTNMGAPTSTAFVPGVNHKHPSGTLINGTPDNPVDVIYQLLYGNCTAPNCTRTFACGSVTRNVSAYNHIHPITGSTGVPDSALEEVAGSGHRHTGNTDDNTTGETVSHKDHIHNIGGKTVEEITDQTITIPESDPFTVNSDLQSSSGDWLDCNSMQIAPYGSDNPDLNPDIYLNLSIVNGSTVTPISGSPFIVDTDDDAEKSGGPILIDSIVNTNGKYKIRATITNKTEPGHSCRCQLAVRLNGRIFVDTILKG